MVRIPDKDVACLTGGALENLKSESDIAAASGSSTEGKSKQPNIAQSLKYFLVDPPKPNEKPKPLTNDQRIMNSICMRECRKLWKKASDEVEKRLAVLFQDLIILGCKPFKKKNSCLKAFLNLACKNYTYEIK